MKVKEFLRVVVAVEMAGRERFEKLDFSSKNRLFKKQ